MGLTVQLPDINGSEWVYTALATRLKSGSCKLKDSRKNSSKRSSKNEPPTDPMHRCRNFWTESEPSQPRHACSSRRDASTVSPEKLHGQDYSGGSMREKDSLIQRRASVCLSFTLHLLRLTLHPHFLTLHALRFTSYGL